MKINELTVGRKFNLGNFESLELRVSVSPEPADEKEQIEDAIEQMITKLNVEIYQIADKLKSK